MIAIVDYGMGNLRSVSNAFGRCGAETVITRDKKTIAAARAIVLPGVGAFGKCVENLRRFEVFDFVREMIDKGKLYLGICLGMQILFDESEETPGVGGMGVIKGRVCRFTGDVKVPHMGWNSIDIVHDHPVLQDIEQGSHFYFVHSFFCLPEDEGVTCTTTTHGLTFASSVQKGSVFACQFHPEKSQKAGLRLIRNFVRLCEGV